MKKKYFIFLLLSVFFISCRTKYKQEIKDDKHIDKAKVEKWTNLNIKLKDNDSVVISLLYRLSLKYQKEIIEENPTIKKKMNDFVKNWLNTHQNYKIKKISEFYDKCMEKKYIHCWVYDEKSSLNVELIKNGFIVPFFESFYGFRFPNFYDKHFIKYQNYLTDEEAKEYYKKFMLAFDDAIKQKLGFLPLFEESFVVRNLALIFVTFEQIKMRVKKHTEYQSISPDSSILKANKDFIRFRRLCPVKRNYDYSEEGRLNTFFSKKGDLLGLITSYGEIPLDSLCKFENLQSLILSEKKLSNEIIDIKNLENLNTFHINEGKLPKNITILHHKNLTELKIEDNKLESITLSYPKSIKNLSLGNNELTKIPLNIKEMTNLENLSLVRNQITEINVDDLPKSLKIIWLGYNPISEKNKKELKIKLQKRNIECYDWDTENKLKELESAFKIRKKLEEWGVIEDDLCNYMF